MGIVDIFMRNRKFVKCSLNQLREYSGILAKEIIRKKGKPDAIIYIERGGMVIGRLLSDAIGVKRVAGINASYYLDIEVWLYYRSGFVEYCACKHLAAVMPCKLCRYLLESLSCICYIIDKKQVSPLLLQFRYLAY